MSEQCSTCIFWERWKSHAGQAGPTHGDCRRESPKIFRESVPQGGAERTRTKFPTTQQAMWCGDWEQAPPAPTIQTEPHGEHLQ